LEVYNCLSSIFGSLVVLVEYDEIFKKEGIDYFSQPESQGNSTSEVEVFKI